MVWGCFSSSGHIQLTTGIMTSDNYISILEEMFPYTEEYLNIFLFFIYLLHFTLIIIITLVMIIIRVKCNNNMKCNNKSEM